MTGRKFAMCFAGLASSMAVSCAATQEVDPGLVRPNSICVRENWHTREAFFREVNAELQRRGYETLPISVGASGSGCPLVLNTFTRDMLGYSHLHYAILQLTRRGVSIASTEYNDTLGLVRPASGDPSAASIATEMLDELLKQVSPDGAEQLPVTGN